jgi:hypothetical protein
VVALTRVCACAAYWFHEEELLDTSISLSVISPSEEEMAWNQIQHHPLPFLPAATAISDDDGDHANSDGAEADDDWPLFPHRVAAAWLYLHHLIGQVIEDRQVANDFVAAAVIERRYAPLAARLQPLVDPSVERTIARFDCFRGDLDASDGGVGGGEAWQERVADWRRREVEVKKDIRRAAFKQSRLLRDLVSSVSDGVGAIVLANHVEQVANATVGWRNALPFLRLCFPPTTTDSDD